MHPFGKAVLARDLDAAMELFSDDVVFRSPVVFKPYHGREAVTPLLWEVRGRAISGSFRGASSGFSSAAPDGSYFFSLSPSEPERLRPDPFCCSSIWPLSWRRRASTSDIV